MTEDVCGVYIRAINSIELLEWYRYKRNTENGSNYPAFFVWRFRSSVSRERGELIAGVLRETLESTSTRTQWSVEMPTRNWVCASEAVIRLENQGLAEFRAGEEAIRLNPQIVVSTFKDLEDAFPIFKDALIKKLGV